VTVDSITIKFIMKLGRCSSSTVMARELVSTKTYVALTVYACMTQQ